MPCTLSLENDGEVEARDGGFSANNPSLFAITDALNAFCVSKENIELLSVGVGHYPEPKQKWWINLIKRLPPVQLLQKTLSTNANTTEILVDLLYPDIPNLRISDRFETPEMATRYSPDYIAIAAEGCREPGIFIECLTKYPSEFQYPHHEYFEICERVDAEFSDLLCEESPRVITDDKVVGYFLCDYERWGGHQREWFTTGEEIHAESSRLFIKALGCGAKFITVDGAIAEHSTRRVLREPIQDIVTAGFPREKRWHKDLSATDSQSLDLAADLRRRYRRHGKKIIGSRSTSTG